MHSELIFHLPLYYCLHMWLTYLLYSEVSDIYYIDIYYNDIYYIDIYYILTIPIDHNICHSCLYSNIGTSISTWLDNQVIPKTLVRQYSMVTLMLIQYLYIFTNPNFHSQIFHTLLKERYIFFFNM